MKHLPTNLEAEGCLLGAMMLDPDIIGDVADHVKSQDFSDMRFKQLYLALLALYRENKDVDITTINAQLKTDGVEIDEELITQLVNAIPTSSFYPSYTDLVINASQRRDYIRVSQEINSKAYDETITVEDLVASSEKLIDSLGSRQQAEKAFVSLSEAAPVQYDTIRELKDNPDLLKAVSSGYSELDKLLVGGFKATDLILIGGQTSMGKSALSLALAKNAAEEGVPTMLVSLEMSTEQVVNRLLGMTSKVPVEKLIKGTVDDKELKSIKSATDRLTKLPIYIEECDGLTPAVLRHKARIMKAKKGIELIIVDYLNLMKADGKESEEGQTIEFTHISRRLKLLAKELKVPVIALSQLNRKVEGRSENTPRLADLRSSGSLEQDADLVMFVYRKDYQDVEGNEEDKTMQVRVQKHRNGPTGLVKLYFDKDTQELANHNDQVFNEFDKSA